MPVPDIVTTGTAVATTTANNDFTMMIIGGVAFIFIMFVMVFIFWSSETSGNRLFIIRNSVMRKIKFTDKQVSPEGFLIVKGLKEAVKIETKPVNFKNMFGSTNPSFLMLHPIPVTIPWESISDPATYPSPGLVYEGINGVIMRELQTYQVAKDTGATIGLALIAGVAGLFAGAFFTSMM